MTDRLRAMFLIFVPGGVAWSSFLLAENEWIRFLSFVIGLGCTITFLFLTVDEILEKLRAHRYNSWQATEGKMYSIMIQFTQALANMSGSTAHEIFRIAVLRVRGLPGVPITWEVSMGHGVSLGLLVEYLRACVDCYDNQPPAHLWPVRDHADPRFGQWSDVEAQMTDITAWLISMGYAVPVGGNRSAMWCNGYHPQDILDEMLMNYLRGLM